MRNNNYSTVTRGTKIQKQAFLMKQRRSNTHTHMRARAHTHTHTHTHTHNCKSRMLFIQDDFNPDFRTEKEKYAAGRSARNTGT